MSAQEFANAVAYGQITPGPVTHTVALVGYAAAGIGGALVATAVAFAPSFAMVMLGARHFERLRTSGNARAFLDGAGPAAAGAILGAAVPLARAIEDTWQWVVVLAAARRARAARAADLRAGRRRAWSGSPLRSSDGPRRGAAGRDRRGPVHADPLQHRQPAGRTSARARSGSRTTCRTPGSRSRWTAPSRSARTSSPRCKGGDGPTLGYLSHVDTVLADAEDWSADPWGAEQPRRVPVRPRHDRHEEPDGRRGGRGRPAGPRRARGSAAR